jgi:hypothetical protein
MDFHDAWNFLVKHKIFNLRVTQSSIIEPNSIMGFILDKRIGDLYKNVNRISYFDLHLSIMVVKVNPKLNKIDADDSLNTETQVWLESGPICLINEDLEIDGDNIGGSHDYELDCGGPTFEEAIIKMSHLVKEKYGDNTNDCQLTWYTNKQ